MLNQHYLDPMFPLSKGQKQASKKEKGVKWKLEGKSADRNGDYIGDKFEERFLDRIVTPDERLAMRRDFTAIAAMGITRRESGLEFGSGQVLKDVNGLDSVQDANGDECLTFKRTASDRVMAEEARGKTVKNLSRLWQYLGGKSPMDHGYSEAGYHDKPPHEHRKHRQIQHSERRASGSDGLILEKPRSPISSVSDRPKSPFPHPSPTNEEHFFHVSIFSEPFSCLS